MAPLAGGERLRKLLDAVMSLGSGFDLPATLERIVTAAVELTGSEYGAFGLLDETGTRLDDFVLVGLDEEHRIAIGDPPIDAGVLGTLIASRGPVRIGAASDRPDGPSVPPHHPEVESFLGVPVEVRQRVYGFLYLADKQHAEEFDERDEELAVLLAKAAGLAIDNATMRERFAEVVVLEERERIARELHDVVIQRIYGVGLNLQACIRVLDDPELQSRLGAAVSDLDETIDDIRSSIFELHSTRPANTTLRQAVERLVLEYSRLLGFTPEVHFVGDLESSVTAPTAEHLLLVLREALSNVARHAHARSAWLRIEATADHVELTVTDDGVGPPQHASVSPDEERPLARGRAVGQGLRNIEARAEKLGGTSSFAPGPAGGSVLRWTVPLNWLY